MTTQAFGAKGTLLKIGDGGSSAATKASRTMGTTNSQLVVEAVAAGTGGNSITIALVASGNNTPLSISVTGSAITVNLETDGSAASVSTVNDVIAKIYQTAAAYALINATDGVGDGTGTMAAAASAALSGGTNSSETFTTIAEVRDINIEQSQEMIDVTNQDSTGRYKEFIAGLIDGGSVTFPVNYLPDNATHLQLETLRDSGELANFRLVFPNTALTTKAFSAYVENVSVSMPIGEQVSGDITLKVSGPITTL